MMSTESDVIRTKENLQNAIGERFVDYMQSMKKWFNGKITKHEFDLEARQLVSEKFVHLHNEFMLCMVSKSNNFQSLALEASNKTVFSMINTKTPSKSKKKLKGGEAGTSSKAVSYNLRFVPVDPIKHAPSILTASIESAALASQEFRLEFCARERTLPYVKMIHDRMLLGAIDNNLQQVDTRAVFLLAEATVWMLKSIIQKLVSRSKFKHKLRCQSVYENYMRTNVTDEKIIKLHQERSKSNICSQFELEQEELLNKLKVDDHPSEQEDQFMFDESRMHQTIDLKCERAKEKEELKEMSNYINNKAIVAVKRLPSTLFDLKNLLQINKSRLMPSHSIYAINMEKIICSMYHESGEQLELELNTQLTETT